MKSFKLKASVLNGLSHRLNLLDPQLVYDTLSGKNSDYHDPVDAVRACQSLVKKLNEINKEFVTAVDETEGKKRELLNEIKARFEKDTEGKTNQEKQQEGKKYQNEFNERAVPIQKESKAKPDEVVTAELGDQDFDDVLVPLFKKTMGTWDMDGTGQGQKTFIEVADQLGV